MREYFAGGSLPVNGDKRKLTLRPMTPRQASGSQNRVYHPAFQYSTDLSFAFRPLWSSSQIVRVSFVGLAFLLSIEM
jgi:hypothetical protein